MEQVWKVMLIIAVSSIEVTHFDSWIKGEGAHDASLPSAGVQRQIEFRNADDDR